MGPTFESMSLAAIFQKKIKKKIGSPQPQIHAGFSLPSRITEPFKGAGVGLVQKQNVTDGWSQYSRVIASSPSVLIWQGIQGAQWQRAEAGVIWRKRRRNILPILTSKNALSYSLTGSQEYRATHFWKYVSLARPYVDEVVIITIIIIIAVGCFCWICIAKQSFYFPFLLIKFISIFDSTQVKTTTVFFTFRRGKV